MKQIKAVIFDWAGTIVDFGCLAPTQVFKDIFKEWNVEITTEEAREPMGLAKKDHIRALLKMERIRFEWISFYGEEVTENQIDEMYEQLQPKMERIVSDFSEPIPGIVEVISQLRSNGLKIGSTTGYVKNMMEKIIPIAASYGLSPDVIVDSSDCEAGRPAPFMIQRNMELFGITEPSEIVKVGDTVADIQEGINAGVWSVGITATGNEVGLSLTEWNELSDESKKVKIEFATRKLKDAGAHFIIDEMNQLENVIDIINQKLNAF